MKKIVLEPVVTLILTVVMSLCFLTVAEAKPRINAKTVTISKGEKQKLEVVGSKKKVKWSSKNKNIVSVNKNGVIRGKKSGKTTIIAKVGKKKYKCIVYVKTDTVVSLMNAVEVVGTGFKNSGGLYPDSYVLIRNAYNCPITLDYFEMDVTDVTGVTKTVIFRRYMPNSDLKDMVPIMPGDIVELQTRTTVLLGSVLSTSKLAFEVCKDYHIVDFKSGTMRSL